MLKDLETLRGAIRRFNLQRLEGKIVSLAKPAIYMVPTVAIEQDLPLGVSKLGGLPDLPPDFVWKYDGKKPLTFIGQFKLSEIQPLDTEGLLPPHGMLYFFFEADEVPWGETDQRGGWQVFYLEDENVPLVRTDHPTYQGEWGPIGALPTHRIHYQKGLSLPTIYYNERTDYDIDFTDLPGDEVHDPLDHPTEHAAYFDMLTAVYPEPRHYWFGHPYRIQNYVEWDVVTMSQRMKLQQVGEREYRYTDEQIAHIQSEMKKWQFLFQISSDQSLNVMWGDVGTLYVCIPKASLTARQFEDCWTIMQCS